MITTHAHNHVMQSIHSSVLCMLCMPVFFSGPLGGEISPPNTNKFKQTAGCFSHFLSPQKQFPPLNYISRKNPGVCSNEEQSKRQLFSNKAFSWKKGYFVTMNNRTSLREQLYCIHPQHTHSPCTSTCTMHPLRQYPPNCLPQPCYAHN